MNKMKTIFRLLRVHQWYKNLVIFLPTIFGGALFTASVIEKTILGFIALCLLSSSSYIINDLKDLKEDRKHPEKRFRPIASGKISKPIAVLICIALFLIGILLAFGLSAMFGILALALFLISQLYTFALKKEAIADIITISVNFVIRTVSGAFVIAIGLRPFIHVSAWLLLCPFFLAFFLATNKRRSEISVIKKKTKVLGMYTPQLISGLMIFSTTLLTVSYSLYTFFSPYPLLIATLPFALYIIFRLFFFEDAKLAISRQPEQMFKNARFIIPSAIIAIIAFIAIYA